MDFGFYGVLALVIIGMATVGWWVGAGIAFVIHFLVLAFKRRRRDRGE